MGDDANGAADDRDPLRTQLLEAAARVFAAQGYSGTKVQDIVREAGLSSGAMYGRFRSKNELLREAVVAAARQSVTSVPAGQSVADFIADFASNRHGPLTDHEAVQLEAYITARREPDVAAAIAEGRERRRLIGQPLIQQAIDDGLITEDSDIESILYFFDTMSLGLLLQRAAGIAPPHADRWEAFVRQLLAGITREERVRG